MWPRCLTISGNVVHVDPNVAEQSQKAKVSEFAFDCAMDSTDPDAPDYVSQDRCYDLMAKRMVDHVLGGYFSCLFCYGQTGTGKTTTIMGKAPSMKFGDSCDVRLLKGQGGGWVLGASFLMHIGL